MVRIRINMHLWFRCLLLLLFFLLNGEETGAEILKTEVFSPRFQSLKGGLKDNFMSPPVIRLGSSDRFYLCFDEIGEDNSYLSARLIHCDSNWEPSRLVESEYVDGFNTIDIDDYAYSVNTFIHYVNYMLEIPSEGFSPLVSGNYILQVYDRDTPDETLLQIRFRVVEPVVGLNVNATTRTDKGFNDRYQQLSIIVDGEGTDLGNPYQDMKVVIEQNNDARSSRLLTAPLRVDGSRVVYEHRPDLVFPASNEYRRFETTSNRFPGMRVDSVRYRDRNYHVWVNEDMPRVDKNYEFDRTQHGRFIVKEYNSTDSNIGADYVTVHFFLDMPELKGYDVYVDGEMTGGKTDAFNRMRYDAVRGGYELGLVLKQGAYNYRYVTLPKGSEENARPDPAPIEGDKYETENEYNVYVYMRKPGERSDRLIGYSTITIN